jgi:hypothetical protein
VIFTPPGIGVEYTVLIISLTQQSIYNKMFNGYSKASSEFAEGNPLELLSSSNLLYRLKEFAG